MIIGYNKFDNKEATIYTYNEGIKWDPKFMAEQIDKYQGKHADFIEELTIQGDIIMEMVNHVNIDENDLDILSQEIRQTLSGSAHI